jgi:hypothetical protein
MESKILEPYNYGRPVGTPTIAIDFGTSQSAMAITYVGSETLSQELILPKGVGAQTESQSKVQTALLLKKKNTSLTKAVTTITNPADVDVMAYGDGML